VKVYKYALLVTIPYLYQPLIPHLLLYGL